MHHPTVARVSRPKVVPRTATARRRTRSARPYLWLSPVLVILAAALVYPWIKALIISFQDWSPLSDAQRTSRSWVGVRNYVDLLLSSEFQSSLIRTCILAAVAVATQLVFGLTIAVLLTHVRRGHAVLLPLFVLPLILTPAVTGLSWQLFLNDNWGIFNWVLNSVGLPSVGWLSDPRWTLPTIMIVDVWQNTPLGVLILYAGVRAIPQTTLEAAKVDGANAWHTFIHVIVPMLRPLILIVVLFRLIFVLRTFDVIFTLFNAGGPAGAGNILGVFLYEQIAVTFQFSRSAACAYLILLITAALCSGLMLRWYRNSLEGVA